MVKHEAYVVCGSSRLLSCMSLTPHLMLNATNEFNLCLFALMQGRAKFVDHDRSESPRTATVAIIIPSVIPSSLAASTTLFHLSRLLNFYTFSSETFRAICFADYPRPVTSCSRDLPYSPLYISITYHYFSHYLSQQSIQHHIKRIQNVFATSKYRYQGH